MSYLLVDLNQVVISNLMQHLNQVAQGKIDEDLVRHMCVNTLRANIKQFKTKYSEVIICCDNRHYWRKQVFPFYKSHRKSDREASAYDWGMIFDVLNRLKEDLKEHFPYKVIDVHMAEADDVIAVLTARLSANSPVLILSGDKDFAQLQKYANVDQYNPILKRFLKVDDPHRYLKEHTIRGDRGDGIPNFLSPDNTFAAGERQKRLNSKKLEEWVTKDATEFCTTDDMLRGFRRNQVLVDFDFIPEAVQHDIVQAYENVETGSKEKMLNYFIAKGLDAMIQSIHDF